MRGERGDHTDHTGYQEREQGEDERTDRCVHERDVGSASHREHAGGDQRHQHEHHVDGAAGGNIPRHVVEVVVVDELPRGVEQRHHDQGHDDLAGNQLPYRLPPLVGNVGVVLGLIHLLHENLLPYEGKHISGIETIRLSRSESPCWNTRLLTLSRAQTKSFQCTHGETLKALNVDIALSRILC